ncbi:MAG: hypothetical protein GEV07_20525 [Streptosporangiales bacterium]|nr:hypothetical protein [Streptosporangiales bacterium]
MVWSAAAVWSTRDITAFGRARLADVGIAVPDADGAFDCPRCHSERVVIDSEFGAALCRRLAHCEQCGEQLEVMRTRPRSGQVVGAGDSTS